MQNFDIKQMKFILIVTSICLVFACAVMQAYKYLPEEDATSNKLEPSIGIEQTTQYSEDEVLDEESEETNEDEIVDENEDESVDEDTSEEGITEEENVAEEDIDEPAIIEDTRRSTPKLEPLESLNNEVENNEIPTIY